MHCQQEQKSITLALALIATLVPLVQCGAVSNGPTLNDGPEGIDLTSRLDLPTLQTISNEDKAIMQQVRHHIDEDFSELKTINEVHAFLDKVGQLFQRHPKNLAFAEGDLKDLHKFLTQDIVTKLIRLDTTPFVMPISDERMPIAQRAVEEDDLTRKLFSGPLMSLIEAKKQQVSRAEDVNHKSGNLFSNFWCKISGNCSN